MPKQTIFDAETVKQYLNTYLVQLNHFLKNLDGKILEEILLAFGETRGYGGRLFLAGNGGSASIAEHASCDLMKGATLETAMAIKAISLPSNMSLMTALANDDGYDHVFSNQLKLHALNEKDLVLLISSSGESPNIIAAAKYAKACKAKVIGFSGFSGGKLKGLADISVHIPIDNYGIAEDAHQVLMHVFAQYLLKEQM